MMTRKFLPAVRGLVAHRLRREGFGQTMVAKVLGVTQSAVSQILAKDEKTFYQSLEQMGVNRKEASLLVETLCNEVGKNAAAATAILYSFWRGLLSEGRFCEYHRKMYPQLAACDICIGTMQLGGLDEERTRVLKKLESSLKKLETSPGFKRLIPQVGANLVYCVSDATTESDVAGVAGRIVLADDEVKAVGRPMFGGSRHLANILLAARNFNKRLRAAINVKHFPEMSRALGRLGVKYAVVEARAEPISDEVVLEDVSRAFRNTGEKLEALIHGGGIGYEPITYLFSENLDELVERVLLLSSRV